MEYIPVMSKLDFQHHYCLHVSHDPLEIIVTSYADFCSRDTFYIFMKTITFLE